MVNRNTSNNTRNYPFSRQSSSDNFNRNTPPVSSPRLPQATAFNPFTDDLKFLPKELEEKTLLVGNFSKKRQTLLDESFYRFTEGLLNDSESFNVSDDMGAVARAAHNSDDIISENLSGSKTKQAQLEAKAAKERERKRKLREENPEEYQAQLEVEAQKRRDRERKLREENPEEYQAQLEATAAMKRERKRKLREENPEEYQARLEARAVIDRERKRKLREENPEEYQARLEAKAAKEQERIARK